MSEGDVMVLDSSPLAKPLELKPYLDARMPELSALLAGTDVTPEHFVSSTIHALARFPDVMRASRESILLAVLEVAEMGLEPTGEFGGAHLIRFKDEVTAITDYRGFVKMAMRSGQVSRVGADIVYSSDVFHYERGTSPFIRHIPDLERDQNSVPTHAYAVYWKPDGTYEFTVMSRAEIEHVRKSSKMKDAGPWRDHWGEMAKKSCVRRLFKLSPVAITPQMAAALEREDRLEGVTSVGGGGGGEPAPTEVSPRRARLLTRLTGQQAAAEETAAAENGASDEAAAPTEGAAVETAVSGTSDEADDGLPAMPETRTDA